MLRSVTVVEMKNTIAGDAPIAIQWHLTKSLKERGVVTLTETSVVRVEENAVIIKDAQGTESQLPADTIILAAGYRALNPLEAPLSAERFSVQVVGDARQARNVLAATAEGYFAGKSV